MIVSKYVINKISSAEGPGTPGSCWPKTYFNEESKRTVIGKLSARLVKYDCNDNHNCASSFVEIRDHNLGQGVGQERHYCGHETPPQFFSHGPAAQIITSLESDPGIYFENTILRNLLIGIRQFLCLKSFAILKLRFS